MSGFSSFVDAGAYQIESGGAHLFTDMSGVGYDILGLPLIPLLAQLRELGLSFGEKVR